MGRPTTTKQRRLAKKRAARIEAANKVKESSGLNRPAVAVAEEPEVGLEPVGEEFVDPETSQKKKSKRKGKKASKKKSSRSF